MGSGNRKYPKRKPARSSLGKPPKTEEKKVNKEDKQRLIELWEQTKKKKNSEK